MLKNITLVISIFFINALLFSPSYGYEFALLQTTVGAEAVGLGGAIAATVQDPSAIFWNPAGLANISGKQKQKNKTNLSNEADQKFSDDSFDKLFENRPLENGEEKKPAPKNNDTFEMQLYTTYGYLTMDRHLFMGSTALTFLKGTFGVGVLGTYAPGISGYDSTGVYTGALAYGAYAANMGYAWETSIVKMGFSLSGYQQNLSTKNYYGGGLNMGMQMTPIPILHIGALVQNLPGAMQFSSSAPSKFAKLDTILKVSIGISTPPPDASFLILAGVETNLDQSQTTIDLGLQVKFAKYFFLITGIRDNLFAIGFGVNLPFLKVTYAVNQDKLHTGFQHFVDLNFSF